MMINALLIGFIMGFFAGLYLNISKLIEKSIKCEKCNDTGYIECDTDRGVQTIKCDCDKNKDGLLPTKQSLRLETN